MTGANVTGQARLKVAAMFGTRPEAIKMAPLVAALRAEPAIDLRVWVSGQHREMLEPFLKLFGIEADADLGAMSPGQSLSRLFGRIVQGTEDLILGFRPDRVLVHGDTTTAAAAATAAFQARVKVGHVEAGLRSYRLDQPFPEEFNRRMIDIVADQLYAPTERARDALLAENLGEKRISVTGNTVIDALKQMVARLERDRDLADAAGKTFGGLDPSKRLVLVTGHRRENFGDGMRQICEALAALAARGDVEIVYPVHLNPAVRDAVHSALGGVASVRLIEPVDYPAFVDLMRRSSLILTDSGGVQEEAPALDKPVLVLREVTERPEAMDTGLVELVGTDPDRIIAAATRRLEGPVRKAVSHPFGDGSASRRIVQEILS
jgi:UDP-N-acetylglucosamine 2-epimerase (non-hydrolysing)